MSRKKDIDELDLKILNELMKDASLTKKELGRRVGLTTAPTLKRVNTLIEKGYITQYTIKLQWEVFNLYIERIDLLVEPSYESQALEKLASLPFVQNINYSYIDSKCCFKIYHLDCLCYSDLDFDEYVRFLSKMEFFRVVASKALIPISTRLSTSLECFLEKELIEVYTADKGSRK